MSEANNRDRAFAWMDGWRCGAAFLPIPEARAENAEFNEGWQAGRQANRQAKESAEQQFGYTFAVIKPASAVSVYIPLPDANGIYRYPDGSGFRYSERVQKWCGWWAPRAGSSVCVPLRNADDEKTSYFATKEEVAQAIADGGEGSAALNQAG